MRSCAQYYTTYKDWSYYIIDTPVTLYGYIVLEIVDGNQKPASSLPGSTSSPRTDLMATLIHLAARNCCWQFGNLVTGLYIRVRSA